MALRTLFTLIAAFFIFPSLFGQSIEWEENYGGTSFEEYEGEAKSIIQTADGGFALIGASESDDGDVGGNNGGPDYWIVKTDGTGNIQWEENLGGSSVDHAQSVVQTSDGGFAIAGFSISSDVDVGGNNGGPDFWVVKLDNNGVLQWEKNLGGSNEDYAWSMIETSNGGVAMAGYSNSSDFDVGGNNGLGDYWIVKLDSSGNLQWEKNYGGAGSETASSIVQTNDGGFAIAGESDSADVDVGGNNGGSDFWVIKLDGSGNLQWEKNYGGDSSDVARSIVQTSDGGFAVAGESRSSSGNVGGNEGGTDYWVIKLDGNGNLQWEKNLGGDSSDVARSIVQTSDGGFALAGKSKSSSGDVGGNEGSRDYWVVKLADNGILEWENNFGGSDNENAYSIVETDDGGLAVSGTGNSQDGDVGGTNGYSDYWLVKLKDTTSTTSSSIEPGEKGNLPLKKVHPNPTTGQLRIDLGENTQEAQVSIRDITGRMVKSQLVENASTFRTTLEGDAGIYFVELKTADGRKEVRKVVKE